MDNEKLVRFSLVSGRVMNQIPEERLGQGVEAENDSEGHRKDQQWIFPCNKKTTANVQRV